MNESFPTGFRLAACNAPPFDNLERRLIMLVLEKYSSKMIIFNLEKSSLNQCARVAEKTEFC